MAPPYVDDGCETLAFRNPRGESITFRARVNQTGRAMPPVKTTTVPIPAGAGSALLGSNYLERLVSVPVVVPGTISDRAELRRWPRVLDPTLGEGILSVVNGAWSGRELRCTYDAGLDTLEESDPDINLGTLIFRAAWPMWRDAAEQSVTVTQGAAVTTWFPFLPLVLGASSAFASFTVTVAGDVASWPVFTVTGPGNQIIARNLTTGASWQVNTTLGAASVLTVDTRPGLKKVQVDGTNAFPLLAAGSSLWPLVPGSNRVEIAIGGSDPTTAGVMSWRNYWLGA